MPSETTITPTPTLTTTPETVLQQVEGGINLAADVASVVVPGVGTVAATILPEAETALNEVLAKSPHASAVTDIQNIVDAAGPVIAAAAKADPAVNAVAVESHLNAFQEAIAGLKALFGIK